MQPTIVYLDQNKWIQLSRFYYQIDDDEDGRYQNLLHKIFLSVEQGKAIFPISIFHMVETRLERNYQRRKRLFEFMTKVSDGWTIAAPWAVIPRELEKSVNPSHEEQYTVFNKSDSKDILSSFLSQNDKDEQLRQNYYKLIEAYAHTIGNARKDKEGKSYKRRELKYFYARNLIVTLQEELFRLAIQYNLTPERIVDLLGMFEKIPVLDVQLELTTERDRDTNRAVDKNDMADISFLSVAIPYCDVVVSEIYWTTLASRRQLGLKTKYNIEIIRDIILLGNYL
jgi:hypothetical protein